jgi:integrase
MVKRAPPRRRPCKAKPGTEGLGPAECRLEQPTGAAAEAAEAKTRKARRFVPLSERVIVVLRQIEKEQSGQKEGWLFPSSKSATGHIGLSGLEHQFRKIARKLGIPDALKLYCARHTFGTVAMAETKDPGLVREVMGHESLTTTMGYLHPETAPIKAVIDRRNQQKVDRQKLEDQLNQEKVVEQLIQQKYVM